MNIEQIEQMEKILKDIDVSKWKGSPYTKANIANQITQRWGEDAAKEYNPETNCFTFRGWQDRAYKIKKGEKALRSITFVKSKEVDKDGKEKFSSYPKGVCLFFIRQVEKRTGPQAPALGEVTK